MYKLPNNLDGSELNHIIRLSDMASIPFDTANTDYQAYLLWIENGGIPLPAENT
jgi:hypothetical protein